MIPMLAAILPTLAANGLSLLAGAIQAKGKEVVEERLGIKLPESPAGLTPEVVEKLKIKELEHEEFLMTSQLKAAEMEYEAEKAASAQVTERWKADMGSDSYLSKNIRPITLIYLLVAYTIFALLSAMNINVNPSYVNLLGEWGMLIMGAYFAGRTVEKAFSIIHKKDSL